MKNFRLLFLCLGILFLDVASPFNACRDTRTGLEVNISVEDESLRFNSISSKLGNSDYAITEPMVQNLVESSLNRGTFYSEEDDTRYEIKVTSYNIESIVLTNDAREEIEIELPYRFTAEDIIQYYNGKRNFIKLTVKVSIEYEVIIPETKINE